MKNTLSGCLATTALAITLGVACAACASTVSDQSSRRTQGTSDTVVIGKPPAQRIFCAQLHTFEEHTRQAVDGDVLENDFEALASDAQSTPWSGVIQEATLQFLSGHPANGYKVLATLDPPCQEFR
jgi:hypothetical protein